MTGKTFELHLVKPSHYDDDGYVIQWMRSAIPSNSLAALHGIAADCATASEREWVDKSDTMASSKKRNGCHPP